MKALALFFSLSALAAQSTFLEDLFTEKLKKVEFKAPATVLTFIRPGCSFCEVQLKALKCVKEKMGDKVEILAVQASGSIEDQKSDVRPLKLNFPVVKGERDFLEKYGAIGSPTPLNVVVKKGGEVRSKLLGARQCEFFTTHLEAQ